MGGDSVRARALVDYMRGDRSKEGAPYLWRPRPNNILGAVVNASVWVQAPPSAAYYDANFDGYFAFAKKHSKREKNLWVASNDGMVHGASADDGTPLLSFVPGALAPRLNEQVMSNEGVVPFVDGSPFTGDVQLGSEQWRTYLFGALGRGGRAFYALDVTTLDATTAETLTQSEAAKIFKWQFTSADDSDLGYVLSEYTINRSSGQASPIVKLNNGKFAILTGNGYKSTEGKAALMMLFVDGPGEDGNWDHKLDYRSIIAEAAGGNGLSTPTWVDIDNDGDADFVYAGDLKGNVWKFDISSKTESDWDVAFGGKPFYAPGKPDERLPITAAPEVSFPGTLGGPLSTGLMVTFGTGASFDESLFPRPDMFHRIYSIWDRPSFASADPPAKKRSLPRGRTKLVERVYRPSGGEVVLESGANIDYTNSDEDLAKDGWFVKLPVASEMVVSNPFRIAQYIFMVSIRPNSLATSCSGLPEATLYMFNPVTGLPTVSLFGTQPDGKEVVVGISIADQKVAFALDNSSRDASYGRDLESESGRFVKVRVMGSGTGEGGTDLVVQFPDPVARLQWREIPGLRTRK